MEVCESLPDGDSMILIQHGDHFLVCFVLIQEQLTDSVLMLVPYLAPESLVSAALGGLELSHFVEVLCD